MAKVTAVGIKKLYYGDPAKVTADVTLASLKTLLSDESTKQVENIHQDTWSIEEEEPSTTEYRNQLTNGVYRQSTEMGNIQMSFTIGQYDYSTKADLMGRHRNRNVVEAQPGRGNNREVHGCPYRRQSVLRIPEGVGYRTRRPDRRRKCYWRCGHGTRTRQRSGFFGILVRCFRRGGHLATCQHSSTGVGGISPSPLFHYNNYHEIRLYQHTYRFKRIHDIQNVADDRHPHYDGNRRKKRAG